MARRLRTLLLAAVVFNMMPQSGWTSPTPEVAVLGSSHIITGGACKLWHRSSRVDLKYNPSTNVVQCPDLETLNDGLRGPFGLEINLRHIPLSEPLTPTEDCQLSYGREAGDACWYLTELGQSCTQLCQQRDLNYDTATETFAGSRRSGGTERGCQVVSDLFNPSKKSVIPAKNPGDVGRLGCAGQPGATFWCFRERTKPGASVAGMHRYCACHPTAATSCLRAGGQPYAGACFYKGAAEASCDATCASASRQYDPFTAAIVGPTAAGGTQQSCLAVASIFGATRVIEVVATDIVGCYGVPGVTSLAFYTSTGDFDAGASSPDVQRYCACQEEAD